MAIRIALAINSFWRDPHSIVSVELVSSVHCHVHLKLIVLRFFHSYVAPPPLHQLNLLQCSCHQQFFLKKHEPNECHVTQAMKRKENRRRQNNHNAAIHYKFSGFFERKIISGSLDIKCFPPGLVSIIIFFVFFFVAPNEKRRKLSHFAILYHSHMRCDAVQAHQRS